jgi:ATP synthase protein I
LNSSAQELIGKARKVIGLQVLIGGLVVVGFFLGKGILEALSAGYGSVISIILAYLLSRGVAQAGETVQLSSKKSTAILYMGAVQRFILVLALFGVGLVLLKLEPLATVIGFALTQLAYMVMAVKHGR